MDPCDNSEYLIVVDRGIRIELHVVDGVVCSQVRQAVQLPRKGLVPSVSIASLAHACRAGKTSFADGIAGAGRSAGRQEHQQRVYFW